ncbi:DUF935 domain-containing protein [Bergeriella denitrificans]|uniref:Phage protein n=2 Tax=Neisseriaceae TaxID=481 RepID=A0A378UHA0_BERDE|nr:DUF935 family protein [Bergeriella denitrificans]STZ76069.1 phage protein [Bergeriella denitrificans]STZ77485.1 phage protein [Bergeriella denitrificans]STZ83045.1 phage protein [Bergeriella denitrificans]
MKKPHFKLKTPAGKVALNADNLTAHIAAAQRFMGVGGFGGWLPNPDPVLKKLDKDIAVYRELLSDPIVAGHVRRRKAAVAGMDWRLDDDSVAPKTAEAVAALFDGLDLYRLINQILDAALFGYQPIEVVWRQDKLWLPSEIEAKPQEWFHFDDEGRLHFSRYFSDGNEPLPDYKFLCPTQNASYTNPYGTGDLASVYWPTVFKRGGLKFWAEFAEKFGAPWIIGKEPRSNTPADTDKLLDALEQLIGNAVASIPNDSSVEIKEAAGKQGSADVYDRFIRYCRSEIAIALLGQDQTTEKDTNHASATAGLEVTQDIRDSDCRIVESCLNELIGWVCDLNFGTDEVRPKFVLFEESEGGKEQAERDQILTACGVRLSESYWKRAYNLSDEDIAVVGNVETPEHSDGLKTATPLDFAETEHFADAGMVIDTLTPDAGRLNAQSQALTAALMADLQQGETAENLLDRLAAAYPNMDDTALQEELARLIFLSEMVGRIEAAEELAR